MVTRTAKFLLAGLSVYELLRIDPKIPPETPHDKSLLAQFEASIKAFKRSSNLSGWPVRFCLLVQSSSTAKRRAGCGSVRGSPVPSSHFSPGLAPQVGQRTCKACSFLAFMTP